MDISTSSPGWIDDTTFQADIDYLDARWQRKNVGEYDLPIIDVGQGDPVVCVPILEHLDFVYSRQVQDLSKTHRVIFYRRHEARTRPVNAVERAEELRSVLDTLHIERADFIAHGDAAIVLIEFAIHYPQRCRSLTLLVQGPDYVIAPHPFIWFLHELFIRLPVEHILPTPFLSRMVTNYATARSADNSTLPAVPRRLIEQQFCKISEWPSVYKFSVLPVIHNVNFYERLAPLTMPVLVFNRYDDVLTPEAKTRWLAEHLPNLASYRIVNGGERFFMYAQSAVVDPIIEEFLGSRP